MSPPFQGFASRLLALLALLAVPIGSPAAAQERTVLSNEVAVSGDDASLHLLFSDNASLDVQFEDGTVRVDGRAVGSYERGQPLERSWRALLGEVVALDGPALSDALVAWSPPAGLSGDARELADLIDRSLEEAVSGPVQPAPAVPATEPQVRVSGDLDVSLIRSLVGRTDRFIALAEALEELDVDLEDLDQADVEVHIGESVTIPAGETRSANLILIDSDLDVEGTLDGSAILLGGSLEVDDDAVVTGAVHLSEARVVREGGVVSGGINRLRLDQEVLDSERFDALRDEIREELRREIRDNVRAERDHDVGMPFTGTLRNVARGIGGMMENLFTFAILAVLAFFVVRFYRPNLEVVADVARESPTRAGLVGVAGMFLLFPVWILGIVGLCISLIGIPVLLAWIPLFPIAALLAAGLGFLAVASNVGDWVVRQRLQGFNWVRPSNPLSVVLAGVAALLVPFFAANFMYLAGSWLGWVRGLLTFAGGVAAFIGLAVGFGAVLLTRGGRRTEWAYPDDLDLDEAVWEDELRRAAATREDAAPAGAGDEEDAETPTAESPTAGPADEVEAADESDSDPSDDEESGPRA